MALKLYGLAMSTNTTRAMICLHEKEVDFELVPVNVFAAEHKQPPFLSKNVTTSKFLFLIYINSQTPPTSFSLDMQPFGLIPVLEDGDNDLTLFGMLSFFIFPWHIPLFYSFFFNFA